jgi:hypothetical protein
VCVKKRAELIQGVYQLQQHSRFRHQYPFSLAYFEAEKTSAEVGQKIGYITRIFDWLVLSAALRKLLVDLARRHASFPQLHFPANCALPA